MENLTDAPLTTQGHPAWPSDMPQGGSSPRAIFLGPSRWDTSNLTLHIILTQIMMQPVTQPISVIISKEIAKGGPCAVGGQKEIFSSN